jgi:hypothetical protein
LEVLPPGFQATPSVLSGMTRVGVDGRAAAAVALVAVSLASMPARAQPQPPAQPASAAPAQSTPAATPSEPAAPAEPAPSLPSDPERIRRALARPATLLPAATTLEVDGTTFRVTVTQKPFDIWKYWGPKETAVSSNVHTWYFSNWHAEYLRMVTPEAGRRAALYPTATIPLMPGITALAKVIENAFEARAKRKAKEEVREALEEFFRQHPEARLPAPSAPSSCGGCPQQPPGSP